MLPVHIQLHFESSDSAFNPWTVTMDAPGDQGAASTGMQGIGVRAPIAAAVAAATSGLAWVWHIPKGATLSMGTKSMTVAAGCSSASEPFTGSTVKEDGAIPWLHLSFAPLTTSLAMAFLFVLATFVRRTASDNLAALRCCGAHATSARAR